MRVCAALTVFNASWCVERALDSVFAQTRPADEVLVTDDGSTDDTVALIERRYGDRVRVIRLPHGGLTRSRRAAVEAARSEWVALLDADDWWAPAKLERQVAFLESHPEVRWCSTDGAYVEESGTIRASWLADYFQPVRERAGDLLPELVERCFPLVSSMVVQREAYEAVGGYDLTVPYSQDYDLWLKLAARHAGGVVAEPLISYWSSPGQLSRRYEARHRDDFELMRKVARGELRIDPALQRRGAERAAGLAFELAIAALRGGRLAEARSMLREARARGPLRRRLLAWGGSLAPAALVAPLMRSGLLKRAVGGARATPGTIPGGGAP